MTPTMREFLPLSPPFRVGSGQRRGGRGTEGHGEVGSLFVLDGERSEVNRVGAFLSPPFVFLWIRGPLFWKVPRK